MSEFEDMFEELLKLERPHIINCSITDNIKEDNRKAELRTRLLAMYEDEVKRREKAEQAVAELMSIIEEHPVQRAHATRITHALELIMPMTIEGTHEAEKYVKGITNISKNRSQNER